MDELNNSVVRYRQKKEQCLAFLNTARNRLANYEHDFPVIEETNDKDNPKAGTLFFDEFIARIESSKLRLLVAGQFKHGKSTLVNALLGEEVLPAYSTPCTAVITEIKYGERKSAIITFKPDITNIPSSLPERVYSYIKMYMPSVPDYAIDSEHIGTELEDFLCIPDDEDKEQKDSVAESPFSTCQLFWPLELCKNDVEIIDSPGLNENTSREETTYRYVPTADMILHVLNANQLFGQPDKEFIEKINRSAKRPILFIVNRFDQLNTEKDAERVRARAMKELPDYSRYGRDGIFFVSAYKALNSRIENSEEKYAESGFDEFEKKMAQIIEEDRGKIKLQGTMTQAIGELKSLANDFIPNLYANLSGNLVELEKKYANSQKKFDRLEEKKKRMERTITAKLDAIQKICKSDILLFFRNFANDTLETCVDETEVELTFFNKKESHEKALRILSEATLAVLQAEFEKFRIKIEEKISIMLDELKDSLEDQLIEFTELLESVRVDLDMQVSTQNAPLLANIKEIGYEEFMQDILGGAILGGGIGAAAVFIGGRFIALLGGPIGWGLAIGTALASMIIAILNSEKATLKLKEEYIKAAAKKIMEDSGQWSNEITGEITQQLNYQKVLFVESLNRQILSAKLPIEEAINLFESHKEDIDRKKEQLEEYKKEFTQLIKMGEQVISCL